LLGDEPKTWSKTIPLPPPDWFKDQLLLFRDAASMAAVGNIAAAVQILKVMRSDEMRAWFDEHGQVSGRRRCERLGPRAPATLPVELDPVRSPLKIERKVFERDCYSCRYCGLKLVDKAVLVAFEMAVGKSAFCIRGTNAQQHGVVHAFKIVADHVFPHRRGGRTDLDNLVTACPGCNYGKEAFTLEQLGLSDPRDRPPEQNGWDGLRSLLPSLLLQPAA